MSDRAGVVATTGAEVWLEDEGYICVKSNGLPSTRATVTETFGVARDLMTDGPRPVLFDARKWRQGDSGYWTTLTKDLGTLFSAGALLIERDDPPFLGSFPDLIDRLLIPFQIVHSEHEALAFIRRHLG